VTELPSDKGGGGVIRTIKQRVGGKDGFWKRQPDVLRQGRKKSGGEKTGCPAGGSCSPAKVGRKPKRAS